MKTTFAMAKQAKNSMTDRKHRTSYDDRGSRELSKQEHVNPLKVKSSFLRQSLNFSSLHNPLSLHLTNPTANQQKDSLIPQTLIYPSDKKQDPIMDKYQDNIYQNNYKSIEFTKPNGQNYTNSHSRRLSERFSQNSYPIDLNRNVFDQKENKFLLGLSASTGMSSQTKTKNHFQSFAEKQEKSRFSQMLPQQPILLDSSLADFTTHVVKKNSQEESNLQILKDQIQLILKRLAKNQCDIETLKRDKNIDIHMEKVWKEISMQQERFEKNEKNFTFVSQKVANWQKDIENLKTQVKNINHQQIVFRNQMKEFEMKMKSQLKQKDNKKDHSELISSEVQKRIKTQIQDLVEKLRCEVNEKIEFSLKDLKSNVEQMKKKDESEKIQNLMRDGRFKTSHKQCHDWISIVYKQTVRTKKNERQLFNSFSERPPIDLHTLEYFIDENGYLLDGKKFYILDENDNQIKLDERMLGKLSANGILQKIL